MAKAAGDRRRGQALVEFALVMPLFLLFLFGIIEMALVLNGYLTVEQAAKVGVRAASLGQDFTSVAVDGHDVDGTAEGSPGDVDSIVDVVDRQIAYGFGMSPTATYGAGQHRLSVTAWSTAQDASQNGQPTVTVTVAYVYPISLPFVLSLGNITLNQTYTMIQEDPASLQLATTQTGSSD